MTLKRKLFVIIFGTDTKSGRLFDIILIWVILASVFTVIISSVPEESSRFYNFLLIIEWIFTILFTIEYFLRVYISPQPRKYIFSFWGIIDLIAFLPTYLTIFSLGYQYLLVIRIVRLLRIFRIFKLTKFLFESKLMVKALSASFYKISIFIGFMLMIVILMGSIMYVIEDGKNGFDSIPQSIYWAIITITTVGYGDIVPRTVLGKFLSSIVMLIGYAIIAVPTGIVTAEFAKSSRIASHLVCSACNHHNPVDSSFCNHCGTKLTRE